MIWCSSSIRIQRAKKYINRNRYDKMTPWWTYHAVVPPIFGFRTSNEAYFVNIPSSYSVWNAPETLNRPTRLIWGEGKAVTAAIHQAAITTTTRAPPFIISTTKRWHHTISWPSPTLKEEFERRIQKEPPPSRCRPCAATAMPSQLPRP